MSYMESLNKENMVLTRALEATIGEFLTRKGKDVIELLITEPGAVHVEFDPKRREKLKDKPFAGDGSNWEVVKKPGITKDWVNSLIKATAKSNGTAWNEDYPAFWGMLPGQHRLTVATNEIVTSGMVAAIRVFRDIKYEWEEFGFTQDQVQQLRAIVAAGRAIAISGGTGTGKTTLLRKIINEMLHPNLHIVTVQDVHELILNHARKTELLLSRGRGASKVTWADVINLSTRLRPDVVICSELDVQNAGPSFRLLNTGHEAFMITGHANSPMDFMEAWRRNYLMDGNKGGDELLRFLARTLACIVQIKRLPDYSRRVELVVPSETNWQDLLVGDRA